MAGRPSDYSDTLADEICERISNGESLRKICSEEKMPNKATVFRWLANNEIFSDQYARAREEQAESYADEITAIADEMPDMDPLYDGDGKLIEMRIHSAYVQWQKNRVDARKWVASKLKPKKYGDKLELAGDQNSPLLIQAIERTIVDPSNKNS
jgi:hypothetical protein